MIHGTTGRQRAATSNRTRTRAPSEVREAIERLTRLASMGGRSDRLGALYTLAYCFDYNDRGIQSIIPWMNRGGQVDSSLVLDYANSPRRRRGKLVSPNEYARFLFAISTLEQDFMPRESENSTLGDEDTSVNLGSAGEGIFQGAEEDES